MALALSNYEAVLQARLNGFDATSDLDDLVIAAKAVNEVTGAVTVSDVQAEGATQIDLIEDAGQAQVGAVNSAGNAKIAQINAIPGGGGVVASSVSFTPSGNLSAGNVAAALMELDSEKAPIGAIAAAIDALGISAFIKTLLDDPDAATALGTLGVSNFIRSLLDDADAAAARATIGAFAVGGGTFTGDLNLADYKAQRAYLQDIAEVVNARGSISGAQTIDLELGNVVTATITAATTFTFANPAVSGRSCTFVLKLTNGGAGAITWPTSVKWANSTSNAAPALTASGRDRLWFTTEDGGVTWDGGVVGKGFGL
jgi:hypothetical protein